MSQPNRKLPAYRQSLAGSLLAARHAVMNPIRPMLRDAGITEQQWRVLRVLADAGPLEPTTLAAVALLNAPSVTRIVRELVDRGMVHREDHPGDRRRAILSISPTGAALIDRTAQLTMIKLDDYAELFGVDRLARLITELQALVRAIDTTDPVDSSER